MRRWPLSFPAPRQITEGPHSYNGFSLTPDGREVIFSANRDTDRERAEREYRQSEVYALTIETGAIRQLSQRSGPDTNPAVSPDGKWVAYLGYDYTTDTYIDNELYVVAIDGRNRRHSPSPATSCRFRLAGRRQCAN